MIENTVTAASIAATLKLRKVGQGYRGTCPACHDANPSLAVRDKNGTTLVHCFAGCTQEVLLGALRQAGFQLAASSRPFVEGPPPSVLSIGVGELLRRPGVSWLIKGVIPRGGGVGTLIGPSQAGKTFMALDIIGAVLSGTQWFGHRVKESCGVAYIAGEGVTGLSKRVRAYQRHNPRAEWAMLRIIDKAVNFLDPIEMEELTRRLRLDSDHYADIGLIVVDTLATTMHGAPENSIEGMGAYVSAAQKLGQALGAFVLIIHHMGKDTTRGGRGHNSLPCAVDVEITIVPEIVYEDEDDRTGRETGRRLMKGTKMRDGKRMSERAFELAEVVLEKDEDGDPVTSCVVKPVGWV